MKTNQPFAAGIEERRVYAAQTIGAPVVEAERVEVVRALRGTVDATVLDVATKEPAIFWRAGGAYYIDSVDIGIIADIRRLRYSYELGLYEDA
jgi:hypothetical protein